MIPPKIKRLEIEWKHFAVDNTTCERCGMTGVALNEAVQELHNEFASAGVKINLTETLLDKTRIAESNEIRMNSMLIEDLLAASVASTECASCGTLAGESTCCRAIGIDNELYEDIPVWAIKKAAYLALGVEEPPHLLTIEWQHVGEDVSATCERCSATGATLRRVLEDLKPDFARKNIQVDFRETVLLSSQLPDSNRILINGKAFEDYLTNSRIVETPCCSCSCVPGDESVSCRAIETPEGLYESVPADLMQRVIITAAEELIPVPDRSDNKCCR